ncbi:hypothetical protein K7432_011697 [Basidiobolus ranarum]|uniref:Uncharacterized protein n=1 Tax=Basidiobolus ranarum TaxID=34480 RepID=A0ABR2VTJ0_9FUNG
MNPATTLPKTGLVRHHGGKYVSYHENGELELTDSEESTFLFQDNFLCTKEGDKATLTVDGMKYTFQVDHPGGEFFAFKAVNEDGNHQDKLFLSANVTNLRLEPHEKSIEAFTILEKNE